MVLSKSLVLRFFLPFCWQKYSKIPLLYRFVKSNKIDTSKKCPYKANNPGQNDPQGLSLKMDPMVHFQAKSKKNFGLGTKIFCPKMFFRPFPDGFVKIFSFAVFLPFCWQKYSKIPLLYRFVKSNKIDTSIRYSMPDLLKSWEIREDGNPKAQS